MSLFGEFLALNFGSEGGESTQNRHISNNQNILPTHLPECVVARRYLDGKRVRACRIGTNDRRRRRRRSRKKGRPKIKYKNTRLGRLASFCLHLDSGHDFCFKLWRAHFNWIIIIMRTHTAVMKMCQKSYFIPFHRWLMLWLLSSGCLRCDSGNRLGWGRCANGAYVKFKLAIVPRLRCFFRCHHHLCTLLCVRCPLPILPI